MASDAPPLAPEDVRLFERLAGRIAELRLEVPAILALESARPLSLVAGQALLFFQPFLDALFPLPDVERFARLLEHRGHLETLARMIEERAEARRAR